MLIVEPITLLHRHTFFESALTTYKTDFHTHVLIKISSNSLKNNTIFDKVYKQ